jgi:ABC-type antimicrobial peptide transport system permease subunit
MTREQGLKLNWFKNYVIESVNKNQQSVQQFFQLFLYVSLILAFFSIFMLFNYITTSIHSKRQTIGILRALGSGGKDIFTMFATESVIIAFINAVFASIFTGIGSIFVNMYIRNTMNFSIDFAYFGIRQVLLISLFSLVTAVVSSLLPIIRISKEKPVDLIRKN